MRPLAHLSKRPIVQDRDFVVKRQLSHDHQQTHTSQQKEKEGIILMPEPTYNSIVFCIPCEAEIQNTYVLGKHTSTATTTADPSEKDAAGIAQKTSEIPSDLRKENDRDEKFEKEIEFAQRLHPHFKLEKNGIEMIKILEKLFPELPIGRDGEVAIEDAHGKRIATGIERILLGDHDPYFEFLNLECALRGGTPSKSRYFRRFFSANEKTRVTINYEKSTSTRLLTAHFL